MRAVLQGDGFGATEPLHQQTHRGHMIPAIQQCRHDLRETAGGVEVFDMLPPERDISRRFARCAPFRKDSRHLSRRFNGLYALHVRQIIHRRGRVAIPLFGKFAEILQH